MLFGPILHIHLLPILLSIIYILLVIFNIVLHDAQASNESKAAEDARKNAGNCHPEGPWWLVDKVFHNMGTTYISTNKTMNPIKSQIIEYITIYYIYTLISSLFSLLSSLAPKLY